MPTRAGPGQQAMARATNAIPARRATGIAMPLNSSPSNTRPTSAGTTSSARPVAPSAMAAIASTFFIAASLRSVFRARLHFGVGLELLSIRIGQLFRREVEGQLVDLAGEDERDVIVVLDIRDSAPGIPANIEGFVFGEGDRRAMFHGIRRDFLAVHREHALSAFA